MCILGFEEFLSASAALSISLSRALARAQTEDCLIELAISDTDSKSPALAIGNPASITSTFSSSSV